VEVVSSGGESGAGKVAWPKGMVCAGETRKNGFLDWRLDGWTRCGRDIGVVDSRSDGRRFLARYTETLAGYIPRRAA
jgi:hypothetical protein